MSDHKNAYYFTDKDDREDNAKGAAYRDLRNWKAGYLAALNGGLPYPEYVAQQFVESFNAKRAELLTQFN